VATTNITSAQPAAGRGNPRLFLLSEGLIMSVVPVGVGRQLLEFGQFVSPTRTLKAEVEFPVAGRLASSDPFTRVKFSDTLSQCALCHREEAPHGTIPDAFDSLAFRPQPDTEVPIIEVAGAQASCDETAEPYRCQLLTALFAFGAVDQGAFSEDLELFF
jgi:hypothetical protein